MNRDLRGCSQVDNNYTRDVLALILRQFCYDPAADVEVAVDTLSAPVTPARVSSRRDSVNDQFSDEETIETQNGTPSTIEPLSETIAEVHLSQAPVVEHPVELPTANGLSIAIEQPSVEVDGAAEDDSGTPVIRSGNSVRSTDGAAVVQSSPIVGAADDAAAHDATAVAYEDVTVLLGKGMFMCGGVLMGTPMVFVTACRLVQR